MTSNAVRLTITPCETGVIVSVFQDGRLLATESVAPEAFIADVQSEKLLRTVKVERVH